MNKSYLYIVVAGFLTFMSCEKEITVDLPKSEPKLVVEGSISTEEFPFIILTESVGYFDPVDITSYMESFVNDAVIIISDGANSAQMDKLCTSSMSQSQLESFANMLGVDPTALASIDICAYTTFDPNFLGRENTTYRIDINYNSKDYFATTQIPEIQPLDSVWFKRDFGNDSLGFIWARINEPGITKDYYRWAAKRINEYTYGNNLGEQKDFDFLYPNFSVFDDEFINGKEFDFAYDRKSNTNKKDDKGAERGYFKEGDTVVVRFSSTDQGVFKYVESAESQVSSNGSPFATPANVNSNIQGGALGVWAGYANFYDTIVCN